MEPPGIRHGSAVRRSAIVALGALIGAYVTAYLYLRWSRGLVVEGPDGIEHGIVIDKSSARDRFEYWAFLPLITGDRWVTGHRCYFVHDLYSSKLLDTYDADEQVRPRYGSTMPPSMDRAR
jgi:hypothetical protein